MNTDDIQFLSGTPPVTQALTHRRRPLYALYLSSKASAGRKDSAVIPAKTASMIFSLRLIVSGASAASP